jgi:hypothetical protein
LIIPWHLFRLQDIEHGIVDTSQQGQLFSTDKDIPTPIVEEEEGEETSSPGAANVSPNLPSKTNDEGLILSKLAEEGRPFLEKNTLDQTDPLSEKITSMNNLDLEDVTINQEELDRLEQEDPLNAFALLMKSNALFRRVVANLRTFLLMLHKRHRKKIS